MTGPGNDCIFCKIVRKEIHVQLEYEDSAVAAFKDKNPQASVHILIVPKAHLGGVNDIGENDTALLGQMLITAKNMAAKFNIKDSGYRLVMNCGRNAGQAVDHLHLHLLGGRSFGWPPG